MDFNKTTGKRIRKHRELLRLTRDKFCERAGISPNFLSDIEHGKKGFSTDTLYKISKALGVSADSLITDKNLESPDRQLISEIVEGIGDAHISLLIDHIRLFVKTIEAISNTNA